MDEQQLVKEEDGSVTYGTFGKEIKVRTREFKGKMYVDIRKFQKGYPTTKGICIPVNALPDGITLLEKVEQSMSKKKENLTLQM